MAFSPETYALLKAQGGGGGGGGSSLPTPSAANVGQALVVKPKLTTIVPQQAVTTVYDEDLGFSFAVLSNANLSLFTEGTHVVVIVNGIEVEDVVQAGDGAVWTDTGFSIEPGATDMIFTADEGTYTVALYKKSTTEFEYGLQLLQMEVKFDEDRLGDKTWREVESALNNGTRVFAKIPIGGTPHLMTAITALYDEGVPIVTFCGYEGTGATIKAVSASASTEDSYLVLILIRY